LIKSDIILVINVSNQDPGFHLSKSLFCDSLLADVISQYPTLLKANLHDATHVGKVYYLSDTKEGLGGLSLKQK